MLRQPVRIVAEGFFEIITHPVGLDIGLAVDIEAVLVAQFVEPPRQRVMAGPDGVDVVFLHQSQVGEHVLLGDVMTGELVVFVDVDPLELDRQAIDEEPVADDLQATEAYIGLGELSVNAKNQRVKLRRLRRPFGDSPDR